MEHKNFLLAMGLIVGFLLMWSVFVVPRFTPPPAPSQPPASTQNVSPEKMAETPAEMRSAHEAMGLAVASPDMILRDENNEVVLSPKGGAVRNWRLQSKGQEVDL